MTYKLTRGNIEDFTDEDWMYSKDDQDVYLLIPAGTLKNDKRDEIRNQILENQDQAEKLARLKEFSMDVPMMITYKEFFHIFNDEILGEEK